MPDITTLKRILEAALLASSQPLTLPQLSALFDEFEMPTQDELAEVVADLQADTEGRGVELVEVASGFRYQVRRDVHVFVAKLWTERQSRYSRALLETLALIAYRQPITRGEIEQIRGVAVSTQIVRTLEEREWIRVVGYRDLPGKPALFGTTRQFLDYFNLKSLEQLPALDEIREIDDFAPELAFAEAAAATTHDDKPALVDFESAADASVNDDVTETRLSLAAVSAATALAQPRDDAQPTPSGEQDSTSDAAANQGSSDDSVASSDDPPTSGRTSRNTTDTIE